MTRLIITRHGETDENVTGIIQGKEHGNINKKGYKQIKELTKRLKKEKIDLIISSDILRTDLTTKEISKQIKVPVVYSDLIREKDNGEWVGKNHKEVNWGSLNGNFETRKVPGGESLIEVRERGRKFLKELLNNYKNKNILAVSHGAFLKVFIGDLLGMSLYDSIFKLRIDHCSISEVRLEDKDNYQVVKVNNQDFL